MNKHQPLISVVMPVYNGELYISQAIESILSQTYVFFEFIIIDDGSTDRSWDIITEYSIKDSRIKKIRNTKNIGIAKTLNIGIKESQGKYLARFDCDDVSCDTRFEKQIVYLERHGELVILGTNLEVIDKNGKTLGYRRYPLDSASIKHRMFYRNPFAHSSVVIRASVIKHETYDESQLYVEDYDLWFRLLTKGEGANLSEYLIKYRVTPTQIKAQKLKRQLISTIQLQRKYLRLFKYNSLKLFIYGLLQFLLLFLPNFAILKMFNYFRVLKKK